MLVRYWVDAVDGGPKLNQHLVNVSRGSAVRHCVLALVLLSCSLVFDDCSCKYNSPRARGVLFVLKGPYDVRVPPIVKFSQESESARLTKIILSKSTVKTL